MIENYLDIEHDTPESHGYIHERDLPDLERMREDLVGLAYAVCMSGDISSLRDSLTGLCEELDVTIPGGTLAIEKKDLRDRLQWHLGYQRGMIDSLNK